MIKACVYPDLQSATNGFESRAQALNRNEYWLARAKAKQDSWYQGFLKRLDNIIGKMPADEKQGLTKKFNNIIPRNATNWNGQYDERCLDIFIEILGWGWLSDKYQGLAVKFRDTPDLEALNDSGRVVAAMECKNFWMSKKENEYLQSTMKSLENIKAREVDQRLVLNDPSENPFLWKLMCILCKAEEQLNRSGPQDKKFIFVNFSLDTSSRLQIEDTKALIRRLATVLQRRDIDFIAFQDLEVNQTLM